MKYNIEKNNITNEERCLFICDGQYYMAHKCYIGFTNCYETMIFPCDELGNITEKLSKYTDRSGMTLEQCIDDFCAIQCLEETQNVSLQDIEKQYEKLKESIRHNLSAKLMDTSEEHPMMLNLCIEDDSLGISTLELPHIEYVFQDKEGIIWMKMDYHPSPVEVNNMSPYFAIEIIKYLEHEKRK